MKHYPKARGLMTAWIREQAHRADLVGELARVLNTIPAGSPWQAFRKEPWLVWARINGLTDDHVEAVFSEYSRVSLDEKRAAYDRSRAQCDQCVQ
jgi:hypothetical protein